ncbi:hypothetical protein DFH06DRAFT_1332775 [Mycena polygramma]|nr:hypothetical protein DFH06DRAFT_1332775 [Mycena polygramma]
MAAQDGISLMAISIDFRARDRISISHAVSPAISTAIEIPEHTGAFSWSLDADTEVKTTPRGSVNILEGECLAFGANLYVFRRDLRAGAVIQRVLLSSAYEGGLVFNATAAPNRTTTDITLCEHAVMLVPHYGVAALTLSTVRGDDKLNFIHFWTGHITADENIEFDQGYVYQHDDPISQIAVGSSGTYVLILVQPNPSLSYLGLLHFSATPAPHRTFRKLDLGDFSALVARIAFDDSLGLVVVVEFDGKITAISYL